MNLGRVSLTECIQKLKEGKDAHREAGFIVGNFYVEVDVVWNLEEWRQRAMSL